MRFDKQAFGTAARFAVTLAFAAMFGCAHSQPPPNEDLLERVLRTDIHGWPAPSSASGASASAIGKLSVDPLDATLRWDLWPEPATPRSFEELNAEVERLQVISRRIFDSRRVVDLRTKLAQAYWEIYLQLRSTEDVSGAPNSAAQASLERCVISLASIIKAFPDYVLTPLDPTLFRLAVTMQAMGDANRARAVLLRLIRYAEGNMYEAAGYTLFGSIYAQLGDHRSAAAFYVHSLRIAPSRHGVTAYTRYLLARALLELGLNSEGKRALEEAVLDAATFPTAHSELVSQAASKALANMNAAAVQAPAAAP